MTETKTWVTIILVILLVSLIAAGLLWLRPAAGRTAEIYVDGELVRSIDLSKIKEPERFTVETERGVNVILAEPGRIRVESANCPDKVCVEAGWLSDSAAPIVCLPHRLVIRLSGDAALDTEVG